MSKNQFGLLAQFESAHDVYHACEKIRDAGYTKWDAHTPFPVHGLDKAMGLKPSILPWIVLVCGATGGTLGMTLQGWTSALDYPLVISGKPLFSWQAFVPVTFELTILLSAFGAVFGMFFLNRLPQLYHAVFRSDRFARATDDKFFISIECEDPRFNEQETSNLLKKLGATHVEVLES